MRLNRLLKDPLSHFLIAGTLLFILLSLTKPPQQADQIVVDREALLSFIQYRSKAFEPGIAAVILDQMGPDERKRLIDDYIREEALYREALKLGLDENDYVIRQRIVQKLEFVSEAATILPEPDPETLQAYYDNHQQNYYQQPGATFTHVFISLKDKTPEAAALEARAMLETLKGDEAGFEDATRYGERFLFHTNYVERSYDFIKSDFGIRATERIFSNQSPTSEWFGPVESMHGAHLIFISTRRSGRIPPFEEIKPLVVDDYKRAVQRQQKDDLVDAIINQYSPVIKPDINKSKQTEAAEQ